MSTDAPKFLEDLDVLIRARYPLLYLVSWEEQRVERALREVAKTHAKELYAWSITRGLEKIGGTRASSPLDGTRDPGEALRAIEKLTEAALVILKDFHPFMSDPTVVRGLRELGAHLKRTFTTVAILSPTLHVPLELEKEIEVLDVPLPTARELMDLLREVVELVRRKNKATVDLTRSSAEAIVRASLGLTLAEAENALAKAVAGDGKLDGDDVHLILEEKRQVIRKGGLLEYHPANESLATVGGLDILKQWLSRRGHAFSDAARDFGLPQPKGVLLLGVQGCGKSLSAKAIASFWGIPLLRLDMGRIFSSLVGSSEENLRKAIRMAESVAPVVLWMDEIEKALAGSTASGATDGGVTARIFGAFLTWLQDKKAPVFVAATANRVDSLPPELLRKGRFDEIFFVDLPKVTEREEIFRIQIDRHRRDPSGFDLARLARMAENLSGAEIEQAIVSGLYDAFAENTDVTQVHIEHAIGETVPLATTMREEIDALRAWAKSRARPASRDEIDVGTETPMLSTRFE